MSQHLNGSHRRSGDSNSRERQPRNASLNAANSNTVNNSVGGGADYASTNDRQSRSRANNKSNENQIKEAIIDLYLKVKIRSNDEIDAVDAHELTEGRTRLRNLPTLTILAYIKTKFEDLMQLRLEEEKDTGDVKKPKDRFDNGATSEFTSTFHSIDLPPEEYETQL